MFTEEIKSTVDSWENFSEMTELTEGTTEGIGATTEDIRAFAELLANM